MNQAIHSVFHFSCNVHDSNSSLTRGPLVLSKLADAMGKINLFWDIEAKKLFAAADHE